MYAFNYFTIVLTVASQPKNNNSKQRLEMPGYEKVYKHTIHALQKS